MIANNKKISITEILHQYGIHPYFVEKFGKVTQVYSEHGTFALKAIPAKHSIDFINQVRSLFQKGYNRIVPIYPTIDGRFGVLSGEKIYYLMPWVTNMRREKRSKYEQLMRELARLHTVSIEHRTISEEELTEHYELTISQWENSSQFINEYIEHCEKQWYMSPFELLFCQYFQQIKEALQFATKQLKEWYDLTADNLKIRTVINHGKIDPHHFLLDERGYGYFINFEKANRSLIINDLLIFTAENCQQYLRRDDELVDWLYIYFKYLPLQAAERALFLSYLAYPGTIINEVENYYFKKTRTSEANHVKRLQNRYLQMKNLEYIVMRITEIEEQKKAAEQTAQSQEAEQAD